MTTNTNSKSGVTLCSCGSGREAMHCCGASPKQSGLRWLWPATLFALTAAALVGVLVVEFSSSNLKPAVGDVPDPWEYNPDTNQHWDPTHGHWHDGPPPAGAGGGAQTPPPGETPEPWAYDEERNQHWDPVHNHWHEGPPPPESDR